MSKKTKPPYTENVLSTLKYSIEQFDKNILFIASGALGGSFAFIKDIIPDLKKARDNHYLIESWYAFALVIFISLSTHYISYKGSQWAFKNQHLDDKTFNKKLKYFNWPLVFLNWMTIILTLLGAIFLIIFIQHNMY